MSARLDAMSERFRAEIDLVEAHSARNYAPLPVVIAEGEGAWVQDVDGRRYLDLLAAYGALNFGHRHPQLTAVAHAATRPSHADQPGLPQRPARHVLRGARRARRHGPRAADEHRRRGCRDRDQDGAQVGLPGQGHPARPGEDRDRGRQLPRPHDHDRQLLRRLVATRRLRPVHAWVRPRPVRRRRGPAGGDRRRHRGRPDRADPGRGAA